MLSKCANPDCGASFHYLGQGKLYEIRPKPELAGPQLIFPKKAAAGRSERFWLCNNCASVMTLAIDASKKVILLPLQPKAKQAIAS
jgi:hypothetical protein